MLPLNLSPTVYPFCKGLYLCPSLIFFWVLWMSLQRNPLLHYFPLLTLLSVPIAQSHVAPPQEGTSLIQKRPSLMLIQCTGLNGGKVRINCPPAFKFLIRFAGFLSSNCHFTLRRKSFVSSPSLYPQKSIQLLQRTAFPKQCLVPQALSTLRELVTVLFFFSSLQEVK